VSIANVLQLQAARRRASGFGLFWSNFNCTAHAHTLLFPSLWSKFWHWYF